MEGSILGFKNLADFDKRFPDEQTCRDHLEWVRWKGTITCPFCLWNEKIYRLKTRNNTRYKCGGCRKQFTVKVGTIFEKSPLPLRKWFLALYFATSHKKGISSVQLSKHIGVSQEAAWFMLARIRYAVRSKSLDMPLSGVIEADETYVGPKTHRKQPKDENGQKKPRKRGRGTESKVPVFGIVERAGEVRTVPVEDIKAKTLESELNKHVDLDSILITDELGVYKPIGKKFRGHETVNHSEEEYVRYYKNDDDKPDVYTNTIEGAFSLLKRGIVGIYHHVSPEHLHRYCAEFDYRYNTRKMKDAERFGVTLGRVEDRLTYKELVINGVWANRRKQQEEARRQREGQARGEAEEGATQEV